MKSRQLSSCTSPLEHRSDSSSSAFRQISSSVSAGIAHQHPSDWSATPTDPPPPPANRSLERGVARARILLRKDAREAPRLHPEEAPARCTHPSDEVESRRRRGVRAGCTLPKCWKWEAGGFSTRGKFSSDKKSCFFSLVLGRQRATPTQRAVLLFHLLLPFLLLPSSSFLPSPLYSPLDSWLQFRGAAESPLKPSGFGQQRVKVFE